MLENVQLVRNLEQAKRRDTVLVSVVGAATREGKPLHSWGYTFGKMENGFAQLYGWEVLTSGQIDYRGEAPDVHRVGIREIEPSFTIDSPEIVRLALSYGGQAYMDRFPDAYAGMFCRFLYREPVCEIKFYSPRAPCTHGPMYVHTGSGALMRSDLRCLDQLSGR